MAKKGGSKDYKVGYGKPPAEHRFKKGVSGNPRGRPKEGETLEAMVTRVLSRTVRPKIKGIEVPMLLAEMIISKRAQKAVEGKDKPADFLFKHYRPAPPESDLPLDPETLKDKTMEELAEMYVAAVRMPPPKRR